MPCQWSLSAAWATLNWGPSPEPGLARCFAFRAACNALTKLCTSKVSKSFGIQMLGLQLLQSLELQFFILFHTFILFILLVFLPSLHQPWSTVPQHHYRVLKSRTAFPMRNRRTLRTTPSMALLRGPGSKLPRIVGQSVANLLFFYYVKPSIIDPRPSINQFRGVVSGSKPTFIHSFNLTCPAGFCASWPLFHIRMWSNCRFAS